MAQFEVSVSAFQINVVLDFACTEKSQQRDFFCYQLPDIKESNAQLISSTNMLLVIRAVSLQQNKLRVDFQRLHTTKTRCFSDKDTHRWDSWLFVRCILSQSPEKPLPLKLKRKNKQLHRKNYYVFGLLPVNKLHSILTDFRTYLCFFF